MLRALVLVGLCACVVTPDTTPKAATPFDAAFAAGLSAKELAQGSPESAVLGWHLEVTGDRARFYACDDETTCGMRVVELPAKDVIGTKVVGRARPTPPDQPLDSEIDVLRITLTHPITTSRGGATYDESHGLSVGGRTK